MKERGKNGFSIVELALAIGIAAFCLLALLSVIPTGLSNEKASARSVTAADILTTIAADLETVPQDSERSKIFGIHVPAAGEKSAPQEIFFDENGALTDSKSAANYRAKIIWMPPPRGQLSATLARIRVTWPAKIEAGAAQSRHFAETITALDRN